MFQVALGDGTRTWTQATDDPEPLCWVRDLPPTHKTAHCWGRGCLYVGGHAHSCWLQCPPVRDSWADWSIASRPFGAWRWIDGVCGRRKQDPVWLLVSAACDERRL